MRRNSPGNRRVMAIAPIVAVLASLGLAACGSSSGGSSSTAATTAAKTTAEATSTTPTTPTTTTPESTTPTSTTPTSTTHEPTITTRKQFVAVFECLRHNGIKLPPLNELGGKNKVNTNTPQFQGGQDKVPAHRVRRGQQRTLRRRERLASSPHAGRSSIDRESPPSRLSTKEHDVPYQHRTPPTADDPFALAVATRSPASGLAACGSSSGGSSSTAATTAATSNDSRKRRARLHDDQFPKPRPHDHHAGKHDPRSGSEQGASPSAGRVGGKMPARQRRPGGRTGTRKAS